MTIPDIDRLLQPVKVVTAAQMRELDRRATEEYAIPGLLLMENAGRAVFEAACDLLDGEVRGRRVLVVCGPGNNGGDGFVAARHLDNAGADVVVAYYGDRAKAKGDALANLEIVERMGVLIAAAPPMEELESLLDSADLVVDALLGTGISGEIREPFRSVIGALLRSVPPVLSVDIPSGVDADTGVELGEAVQAEMTVTFGLPKVGLVTYPGRERCGELRIADISIPDVLLKNSVGAASLLGAWAALPFMAPMPEDCNKGDRGHLAVVAGSVGMTGAAALAAAGAMRMGAGLVTLAVPQSLNDILEVKLTEAMTIPVPESENRAFGPASLDAVLEIVGKRDAAVIGPGLGRSPDTVAFALALLQKMDKPAVVDADALFAVSTDIKALGKCRAPLVLTPHPGEMARLLGTTAAQVQSNRLDAARSFAAEHAVVVVLKGAGTVVAEPDGTAWINTTGTPAMATGGAGDVLSGMIGALLAGGGSVGAAACAGVYLHGKAGEIAADSMGENCVAASDIAESISLAVCQTADSVCELRKE